MFECSKSAKPFFKFEIRRYLWNAAILPLANLGCVMLHWSKRCSYVFLKEIRQFIGVIICQHYLRWQSYIHNTHCIRTRNIAQMWFIYVFVYMHFRSSCKSQSRYLETCVYKQKLDLILFHPITGEGYFLWFRIPLKRVLLTPARFLKLQGIFFPVLMTSLTQNMYWLLLISQWYNNRARVISTAGILILLDNEAS